MIGVTTVPYFVGIMPTSLFHQRNSCWFLKHPAGRIPRQPVQSVIGPAETQWKNGFITASEQIRAGAMCNPELLHRAAIQQAAGPNVIGNW
jgi:hypothetical protein